MKHVKKIMALVLAMVMVLAMGVTTFAQSAYKITVTNTNSNISIAGKTYSAYKLFDATYEGQNVASYTIAKNNQFYSIADSRTVLEKYFTFTETSGDPQNLVVTPKTGFNEAKARELADELQPFLADATADGTATVLAGSQTVDVEVAGPGYYLVDGQAASSETGATDNEIVAAVALTTAKPTATVNPKADVPSVDKTITKIAGGTDKVESDGKTGNGSVGDKVEYKLESKVPDMTGYKAYQFIYTDTMTSGLTFNDDVAITIDGQTYTAFTVGKDGQTITITFDNFIAQASKKGKDIVISYSATINQNAVTTGKEDNTVDLQYSHNPYDEHAGQPGEVLGRTPESKTEVYDTNIELTKVDAGGNKLTGAKFKIEGNSSKVNIVNREIYKADAAGTWYRLKNGTYTETAPVDATASQYESTTVKYVKTTEVIDKDAAAVDGYVAEGWVTSNSTLSFNGLGEGTYTITELVSPEGYNLLTDDIEVVVTFDSVNKVFTATVDGDPATVDNNTIKFDVVNNNGTVLPSTGGMGTTLFYVLGSILLVGAVVLLVTKKRMSSER